MTVRQLVCLLASLAVLPNCATSEAAHKDGADDRPDVVQDARGHRRIPDSRQPTADELAAAFDPQAPPSTSSGIVTNTAAPAPVDPLADQKQAFEAQAADAERAIAEHAEDAIARAEALAPSADLLGPAYVTRAWSLRTQAAHAAGDDQQAFASAQKLLLSCGPNQPDACRADALRRMDQAARGTTNPKKAKKLIADLREADSCLKASETAARRGSDELPKCLPAAERLYRSRRDRLMQARVALAEAQTELADPKHQDRALRELTRAERLCTEERCVEVRRSALQWVADAELRRDDPTAAARAAIREMQLHAATLPPPQRPWAWTETMERACAALDAARGPGACRALERRETGALTFRDYSKQSAGEGLGADVVRAVNAHYGVTFQECLASEAERLRMPAQERYTVRWVVLNDGRVGEMHMDRKERDQTPLANCLRGKLTLWRYPRYEGEYQHVEQSFVVTAQRR